MIGQSISHYLILEKLGEGGMGIVYKARDLHLDRFVAIKILAAGCVADEDRRRRFVLEAKAASALSHPNIVTIHDIDSEEGTHFIAMEYVPGKTLAASIGPTGLPIGQALDYAAQISGALAAAHSAGIIHRDLKPANVMISDQGTVKVLDFGLAKLIEEPAGADETTRTASLTRMGTVLGTAAYMSPEQAAGQHVDVRTDIFSFGSLLYETVTGNRAFAGDSTASILAAILRDAPPPAETLRPGVSTDLARILYRCLEKDREARYPSAIELHKDLTACRERLVRHGTGIRALLRQPRFAVPALIIILALFAIGTFFAVRSSRIRWAKSAALPEAARLIEEDELEQAFRMLRQAKAYIPDDPELIRLQSQCTVAVDISTTPPDAEVSWKSYRDIESPWETLGRSPLKGPLVPGIYLRFKIVKDGYEPLELAAFGSAPVAVTLYRTPAAPGMVHIPRGSFRFHPTQSMQLDEFWLDRYEVTNRQFKEFVDQGGYRDRKYWKHEFADNGKPISWEEAMTRLRDATGRPGPATWELGTYGEGQEHYPVGGVSWYEAAAYAEFAGKSLPTIYHWRRAAPEANFGLVSLSNFGGKGPARVGSYQGLAPYGNYDMAGNVKEWCWNGIGGYRYLLGAAWNEQTYQFIEMDGQAPLTRFPNFGFRCAKYLAPVPDHLLAEYRFLLRDYSKEKPVGDEIYGVYRNMFAYDRTELAPSTEAVDDSPQYWRREKVTFNAAYQAERVIALLFLPRNAQPPYQAVVYFPGASAFLQRATSDSITGSDLDFIMRSGRALIFPIYRETYERATLRAKPPSTSILWRDVIINCSKDLGRSVDYLETRSDIDRSKIAYFGYSAGAVWGPVFAAVDERFRTAVYVVGGLANEPYPPEVDPLNFASRVHLPVLMLNGRYDFSYPLQGCQLPLFRLLGTPGADKRHVLFDSAHVVPRIPMIREILDWLDRYLGPVRTTG